MQLTDLFDGVYQDQMTQNVQWGDILPPFLPPLHPTPIHVK